MTDSNEKKRDEGVNPSAKKQDEAAEQNPQTQGKPKPRDRIPTWEYMPPDKKLKPPVAGTTMHVHPDDILELIGELSLPTSNISALHRHANWAERLMGRSLHVIRHKAIPKLKYYDQLVVHFAGHSELNPKNPVDVLGVLKDIHHESHLQDNPKKEKRGFDFRANDVPINKQPSARLLTEIARTGTIVADAKVEKKLKSSDAAFAYKYEVHKAIGEECLKRLHEDVRSHVVDVEALAAGKVHPDDIYEMIGELTLPTSNLKALYRKTNRVERIFGRNPLVVDEDAIPELTHHQALVKYFIENKNLDSHDPAQILSILKDIHATSHIDNNPENGMRGFDFTASDVPITGKNTNRILKAIAEAKVSIVADTHVERRLTASHPDFEGKYVTYTAVGKECVERIFGDVQAHFFGQELEMTKADASKEEHGAKVVPIDSKKETAPANNMNG